MEIFLVAQALLNECHEGHEVPEYIVAKIDEHTILQLLSLSDSLKRVPAYRILYAGYRAPDIVGASIDEEMLNSTVKAVFRAAADGEYALTGGDDVYESLVAEHGEIGLHYIPLEYTTVEIWPGTDDEFRFQVIVSTEVEPIYTGMIAIRVVINAWSKLLQTRNLVISRT